MLFLEQNAMSLKAPLAVTSSEQLHFHFNICTREIQEHIDHQVLVSLVLEHVCSRAECSWVHYLWQFMLWAFPQPLWCWVLFIRVNEIIFVAASGIVNTGKRCFWILTLTRLSNWSCTISHYWGYDHAYYCHYYSPQESAHYTKFFLKPLHENLVSALL